MRTVAEIVAWLETIAPTRLAESWDNVGLLAGDPSAPCERAMTCLTLTVPVAEEAIHSGAHLVVTHHPILFRPVQSIRADRRETEVAWRLSRAGIAVYSAHTAYDNATGGINDQLAARIGLVDVEPLQDRPAEDQLKVVVFCPREVREPVLAGAFDAGAGRIGAYAECSYSGPGVGTFRGDETSNPTIGEPGRRESVREWRVELICPARKLTAVLAAIREAHTYETPAIDVYPTHAGPDAVGVGRMGRLAEPEPLGPLAARIGGLLGASPMQYAGKADARVRTLAIVCGAGDDFLSVAAKRGADALLTGEARYHRAIEAHALGVGLILAGHHATERPAMENLASRMSSEFAELKVWASRAEIDPLNTDTVTISTA